MVKLIVAAFALTAAMPAIAQDSAAPPPVTRPPSPGPGGYSPPPQPPVPAGAAVQFQPSMAPDQAFPPPAPLASYPYCKRGQFNKCRQRIDPK